MAQYKEFIYKMKNLKRSNKKVFFITYDGLRDPLGQSQILPYIRLISKNVKYIHIISFEKKGQEKHEKVILPKNVGWTKCNFSPGGIFSKLIDLISMITKSYFLCKKYKFNILHARSYPSMHVVYLLKKIFKFKSIFDTRGFWVDDRIEGNIWPQKRFLYRLLYKYYKFLEKKFIIETDVLIVLTKKAKQEIVKVSDKIKKKTFLIPCCADYNHFKPIKPSLKKKIKKDLNIQSKSIVISYLGSIGSVYLFDQMIIFFDEIIKQNKKKKFIFLIITKYDSKSLLKKIVNLGYKSLVQNIRIVSASRAQVPKFLGISDLMLTFRMSSYSQIAASPTKITEAFSMGIPIISNKGIGDVDEIIKKFNAGLTFNINSQKNFKETASKISHILKKGGKRLRNQTKKNFSLIYAEKQYRGIYNSALLKL